MIFFILDDIGCLVDGDCHGNVESFLLSVSQLFYIVPPWKDKTRKVWQNFSLITHHNLNYYCDLPQFKRWSSDKCNMIISFSTQVSLGASVWRPSRQFWGETLLHRISKCVFCRLRLKSTTPSQLVTLNLAAAIWKQIKPLSFRCVSPFLKTQM